MVKYIIVLAMLVITGCADKKPGTDLFLVKQLQDLEREVSLLREQIHQTQNEFNLIRINSGTMVGQVNALTQVVHELKKSYKVSEKKGVTPLKESGTKKVSEKKEAETTCVPFPSDFWGTKPKIVYIPYRETDSEVMLHMLNAQILDNTLELEKMNRNLDDIEFQVGMDSMRRDYNCRREHPYNYLKLPGTIGNQCDY